MSQTLMLLSGPSGCGKTTFATSLATQNSIKICSTDNYFMVDGIYKWDRNRIGAAHSDCYNQTHEELMAGRSVIVDNTNLSIKEMNVYINLADKYKANLSIYRPEFISVDICSSRNVHRVPTDTILSMIDRFCTKEKLEYFIKQNYPNLVYQFFTFSNR